MSYSSHYAQAYSQGYGHTYTPYHPVASTSFVNNTSFSHSHPPAAWYQPGNCRCTYKGCTFSGSHKALETHMMDRHLIYPPGWEKRPKKPDWDADPSLKGKPIPIQGTNLNLDKPEDLEAWIAERKRRWPTALRVEEKKRKLDEAIARGQLPENLAIRNKRQRTGEGGDVRFGDRGRGRGRGRGNAKGRGRATVSGWQTRGGPGVLLPEVPAPSLPQCPAVNSMDSEEDDDRPPEVISSKAPVEHTPSDAETNQLLRFTTINEQNRASNTNRRSKRPPPQPKREPHNPFASRPTLLRNLLLPEIRMTISNLSQAIRFLVDNDFLDGVEATPGAADSKMIQIISDDSSATLAPSSIEQ